MKRIPLVIAAISLAGSAFAQDMTAQGHSDHMMHMTHTSTVSAPGGMADYSAHAMGQEAMAPGGVTEGGQAAFAAIQEIVARLMADPDTDWSRVDIAALRQHLIDMDNVTLRAAVQAETIADGARFLVTSADPAVTASIRTMVPAHAATMNGVEGWDMQAGEIPGGASLTVTGDPLRIRALGFIGIMTVGMHHQAHHLALASGMNPHRH